MTPAARSPDKNREYYSGRDHQSQPPEGIGHHPVDCVTMHLIIMRALNGD
jgi:hypothetical protein